MTPTDCLTLATKFGHFAVHLLTSDTHASCLMLSPHGVPARPVIRIQSACLFAEAFCAVDCDCGAQLHQALSILKAGGYLLYLFQEGRSLGLEAKMRIMAVECATGVTTDEAMNRLQLHDARRYDPAVSAMKQFGMPHVVSLMTNNTLKIQAVEEGGFEVTQVPWDATSRKWILAS